MERDELLKRIRSALEDAFSERLEGVILYGSEARGEAEPDSDIDLLVLLRPMLSFGEDLKTCIHALYPLVLELDRPIDSMPVDATVYEAQEFSLYRNAKREGVPV